VNITNHRKQLIFLGALLSAFLSPAMRALDGAGMATAGGSAVRLEDFEVSESRTSAQTMAPTESRLDAVQPQSIINVQTIQNSIAPTADYAMIANLAPSVTNFSTNGPGLSESKLTLRGFTDGNYNVTIDGIPFGDGNDFTHHTTSYFPAKLLGRVTVDRGPGTASTIGMATFGGTIALETKDPRPEQSFVPTLSYGSWKTQLEHFEYNTGVIPKTNGGSLITSYQYMSSDGYRTFATLRRNTYFFKYIQPVGAHSTLTFMGEYNNIRFNNPNRTLTGQDIITLGRNFGLTNDPLDRNGDYYGNNYQSKQTDTGFIAYDSDFGGGWKLDAKVYTFSYNNSSHESPANNGGSTINPVTGKVVVGTDLAGRFKVNGVRAVGNTLALTHDDAMGTFKTGLWFDYQHGPRYQYALDYNIAKAQALGMVAMPAGFLDPLAPKTLGGYVYKMHFYTKTWEPYVEYAWHPLANLTLTPGLKYMTVRREISAPINQSADQLPAYYTKTYTKAMPLVTANYLLTPEWSTYAQYATGFLTPPLAFMQVNNPKDNVVKPQTTTNYQVGTVYKVGRFNADFDGYFIRSHDIPVQQINPNQTGIVNPNDLIYFTASGAYYYGLEAQATFYLGGGFSLYGNASRNYATYEKSKRRIDSTPQSTGSFGFVYDHGGFFASLMNKYSGNYTTYQGAPNPDQPLPAGALSIVQGGYTITDLSLGYGARFERGSFLKSYKIRLQVNNLLDRKVSLLKSAKATSGAFNPLTSTYNSLTPIGFFLTASGQF
jgi:iron complex outermembrane receptor protein